MTKLVALALLLVATTAQAQTAPKEWEGFKVESLAGQILKPGENSKLAFGARASTTAPGPLGVRFYFRAEAWETTDGAKAGVDLTNAATFSMIEAYVAATRYVWGGLAIIGAWGAAAPVDTRGQEVQESRPQTMLGGLCYGNQHSFLAVMYGKHEATGTSNRVVVSGRLQIAPRLAIVADAAERGVVRAGVAVELIR